MRISRKQRWSTNVSRAQNTYMILGHGIELIETKDYYAGLTSIQAFVNRDDARVYTVDTFWQGAVASSFDLIRAILDSMQVWDWYDYRLNVSLAQCLTVPDVRVHVVVVALNAASQHLLADKKLLKILGQVHQQALYIGKQFRTVFFTGPLAAPTPRL